MLSYFYYTKYYPLSAHLVASESCTKCRKTGHVHILLYQKEVESNLSVRKTGIITGTALCYNCYEYVPVKKWTPNLEQHFRQLKKNQIIHSEFRFKPRFYIVILILALGAVGYVLWKKPWYH